MVWWWRLITPQEQPKWAYLLKLTAKMPILGCCFAIVL